MKKQRQTLIETLLGFTKEINMKFGLEKCAKANLKWRNLFKSSNIRLDKSNEIRELDEIQSYKYLE